jgi:prolyl oligopeptidase
MTPAAQSCERWSMKRCAPELPALLLAPLLLAAWACKAPDVPANAARAETSPRPSEAPPVALMSAVPSLSPPPPTVRHDTADTLFGVRVEDPYRWLEPVNAPDVQKWVHAQSGYARQVLDALPTQAELTQRFTEILYLDAISPPEVRGGQQFYSRRYKTKEKSILMVRPVAGEKGSGEERALIDPNEMSPDGSVSLGDWFVSWDGKHVAYALRENNADESTLYVRDVASGKDSAVDVIPGAKYAGPSWTPDNAGFYYEWLPPPEGIEVSERPGRTELRYHALGSDPKNDPVIFPATLDPKTFLFGGVSRDGRWLFVGVQHGWNQTDLYVKDARKPRTPVRPLPSEKATLGADQRVAEYAKALGFEPFVVGKDAIFRVSWWDGAFYVRTNHEAPNYRVLKVKPGHFALNEWKEIVPESAAKLDDSSIIGGRLVLSYLKNAASAIELRDLDGKLLRGIDLPGVGSVGGVLGDPDRDEAYFSFTSFTVPSQIFKTSIASGATELWSEVELPIDTRNMVAEQTWYTSKDGTRVSMFVVHQKGIPLDGSHPTLLYGYGGFNIDMTPAFSALAAVWLEHGGVYAVPNLRGGGEYGEAWHRAGMGKNKQNVFDDFAGAAQHLVALGYTRPEKLAIYGGSNGGLLVGAAMTQHPELFGAVVCGVPLLDMVRYPLFGSGKTWIAEYGSPENADEFAALYAYSPYHHVQAGAKYPSLLMMAADSDDRVDPMHARKFTAAVQWSAQGEGQGSGKPALFRVEENAGHGGGDMVKKRVASSTDIVAFLLDQLGAKR